MPKTYSITAVTLCLCLIIGARPLPASARTDGTLDVRLVVDTAQGAENSYNYRLLDLALSSQDRPYTLGVETVEASQLRRMETVRSSAQNYVIVLGSSQENERTLRAVYVPVNLGVDIRHRILLTRRDMEQELGKVRTLDDLKRFVFGQGLGWGDVTVLEAAGFKVFTAPSKPILMRMLAAGRIDVFPRGLLEVVDEFEQNRDKFLDVIIDQHLVLTYPIASFFFVNPENKDLHDAIRAGLEKAHASGRMQDLFMADPEHREALKLIRIDKRRHIAIPDPGASKETIEALNRFALFPGKRP